MTAPPRPLRAAGVASMPMYDIPQVRPALDALWGRIARNLRRGGVVGVPRELVHGTPLDELWSDPDVLFSQCCGYDVTHRFADRLRVVATPCHGAPGCEGSNYSSVVIAAAQSPFRDLEDLRGVVCVINGFESHSGMNSLRAMIAPLSRKGRFFAEVKVSGAHAESLAMVVRGEADVAAIDCVTYALLARHQPQSVDGTRPLLRTASAPGVPYVTHAGRDGELVARLQAALAAAFDDPDLAWAREELLLVGVEVPPGAAYDRVNEVEAFAASHDYPELR